MNEKQLLILARHYLGFETLETRMSDSLDFKEVAVWQVKAALEEAYLIGLSECPCNERERNKDYKLSEQRGGK